MPGRLRPGPRACRSTTASWGPRPPASFDALVADLRAGARSADIPPHGTLNRVRRTTGLEADPDRVAAERAAMAEAQAGRAAEAEAAKTTVAGGAGRGGGAG